MDLLGEVTEDLLELVSLGRDFGAVVYLASCHEFTHNPLGGFNVLQRAITKVLLC